MVFQIGIGIAIAISISDEDRDRDRDLDFGDQGHALVITYLCTERIFDRRQFFYWLCIIRIDIDFSVVATFLSGRSFSSCKKAIR